MVDRGHGPAVLMISGIQGRWKWMSQAVDALAARCLVISGSLAGDRGSLRRIDPADGFDSYLGWADELLDRAGLEQVAVRGVSYGGLVALHYAAYRPERVESMVLVSTPSPRWKPNCCIERYLRAPRLMSPVFALSSPFRLYPEISRAFPNPFARAWFALTHLHRVTWYPCAPASMAERVRLLEGVDFLSDRRRRSAPTLVVTGARRLNRIVPVESTREYLATIPGAAHAQIDDTGHIGLARRPEPFAEVVGSFVATHAKSVKIPLQVSA
jgi:3-oxoadipate enol-lactonase